MYHTTVAIYGRENIKEIYFCTSRKMAENVIFLQQMYHFNPQLQ